MMVNMNTRFGYCRVGSAVPVIRPGAVRDNVAAMAKFISKCGSESIDVLVFPELCVTGYTCADLFYQDALLDVAEREFRENFLKPSGQVSTLFLVGFPVRVRGQLFNCALVCHGGSVIGIVPKTFLPNTREFYEQRWFSSAADSPISEISFLGASEPVPFGTDLVFQADADERLCIGVEICEDFWAPVPPSTRLALQGATVLCNLSASNESVGKHDYRKMLVGSTSARVTG